MSNRFVVVGAGVLSLGLLLGAAPREGGEAPAPAEQAFMSATERMNRQMMRPMVGDADIDFANMMIAHHQGAIDMANVELQYGADPEMRAKAQEVIDAQSKEIEELQDWLKVRKGAAR